MSEVFVGDVGTEIVLDCGADVSAATVRRILVRKPDGKQVQWDAVADGVSGIKHVTQASDLDVAGKYTLQAYLELPSWRGRGQVTSLTVYSGEEQP